MTTKATDTPTPRKPRVSRRKAVDKGTPGAAEMTAATSNAAPEAATPAIRVAPEAATPVSGVVALSPRQYRMRQLEREFGQVIKQCKGSLDGTVELLYLDQTSGLKAPGKHRLDEVGGVDGMRVVFRGQVGHLLKLYPARGGQRMGLANRHVMALRLCDEHAARSDGFGQWLTEQNAAHAAQECVFFLQALHVVLQPYPDAVKEKVVAAYWARKDPEAALMAEMV